MFDIGFWEMSIIFVVALLVVGPERLPDVARKAGLYIGKVRRFVTNVRSDIERELRADDLEKMLNEQKVQIQELKGVVESGKAKLEEDIREVEDQLTASHTESEDTPTESSKKIGEDTGKDSGKSTGKSTGKSKQQADDD